LIRRKAPVVDDSETGNVSSPTGQSPDTQPITEAATVDEQALPGPEPSAVSEVVEAKRSRALWIVLVTLLIGMVLGAVALATVFYIHGSDWKDRASSLSSRLDASEQDVHRLQGRVNGIAAEKAAVEDDRATVQRELTTAEQLAVAAGTAATKMGNCNAAVADLLRDVLAAFSAGTSNLSYLVPLGSQADSVCNDATASYNEFLSAVRAASSSS
jgi:outer membrane murein-binding lipoprotein Lpp